MIRYAWDDASVRAQVHAIDPRWFTKAGKRAAAISKLGSYAEKSSIWSVVKEVFMGVQQNKCVFCERQFETLDYGRIEFDLEHFRPKSSVNAWPDPVRHPTLKYPFAMGSAGHTGYYWLAYELSNYAASCKPCNSVLKSNYFPVAGGRAGAPGDDLNAEQAYLCYPLGDVDEDPEKLVTFVATTAVPVASSEMTRRRGAVIIDFFGLNDRQQLHRERARMISLFGPALAAHAAGRQTPSEARLLSRLQAPDLPHAGCLRAFERCWASDPELAARIYEACRLYAVAEAGAPPPAF